MTALDSLLSEAILKGLNTLPSDSIDIADQDVNPAANPNDYKDGWSWRPLSDSELNQLNHRKPGELSELQDFGNSDPYAEWNDSADAILGFTTINGQMHYRVRGRSVMDLIRRSGDISFTRIDS